MGKGPLCSTDNDPIHVMAGVFIPRIFEGRSRMNEMTVHVEDLDAFVGRTVSLVRRLDRGERRSRPAQLSFETMEALLRVLTPGRWSLFRHLKAAGPSLIRAVSRGLRRDSRGVHADVMALIEAGFIVRDEEGRVSVPWSRITAELALDTAA